MRFDRFAHASVACLFALAVAACGGRDTADDEAEVSAETEAAPAESAAPAAAPSAAAAASAPMTAADIDRWQKGMAGELEAVRATGEKMKSARSGEDTLNAMMGAQESATIEQGARAAGVDLERYRTIRSNLSAAASYLAPHVGGIDTTMLSPAQRDELRKNNEAQLQQLQLPEEVIEALRPRAAELRKQDLELVGARLKAAGA